jgi:hypothetical protein
LLRLGVLPNLKTDQEFQLLLQAYRDCAPLVFEGYPVCSLDSLVGLFVFGSDALGSLLDEPACSLACYIKYKINGEM